MNIMIDWDSTYTADPGMWNSIFETMWASGHEIYIVTSRGMDTPIEYVPNFVKSVVYCNFRAKKEICDSQGIFIDIWIDDNPYYIDHSFTTEAPTLLF